MGQYLDLIRQLGLDDPEAWKPPAPPPAPEPVPNFRATNQFDPMTGQPVVAIPTSSGGGGGWAEDAPVLTKATGIGPAVMGDRYIPASLNELLASVNPAALVAEHVLGGGGRPRSLREADPYGVDTALAGKGPPPMFAGTTEELDFLGAIAKKLPRFAAALKAYRAPTEAGQLAAPFYSRLEEAVGGLPKQFGAGALTKGGASAEELAMRGVPEFLSQQGTRPVQKAAMEAHLAAHPLPGIEVKVLGGPPTAKPMPPGYRIEPLAPSPGAPRAATQRNYTLIGPDGSGRAFYATDAADAQMLANDMLGLNTKEQTKFSRYQLPGGTNYRETLLTLPERPVPFEDWVRQTQGRDPASFNSAALDRLRAQHAENPRLASGNAFKSSHFDEPNILAHSRSNEREIPGLGKGTFLEEGQSDWLQEGKEKGFARDTSAELATLSSEWETARRTMMASDGAESLAAQNRLSAITDEMNALHDLAGGVPDAPFKDTWPDLLLKHHLADAAQNPETQWLGFTSGQTQIDRWGTERLTWTPAEGGGYHVTFEPQVAGNALGGDLGAQGLAAGHIRNETRVVHSEADLKELVSGSKVKAAKAWKRITGTPDGGTYLPRKEGMEAFYDDLLPKRLEKIVKPYGGTVERMDISTAPADVAARYADQPNHPFNIRHNAPAWILRLTPELKARILRYGLPLLTGVAAVEAGTQADPADGS